MSISLLHSTGALPAGTVGYEVSGNAIVPVAPSYSWSQQYSTNPPQFALGVNSFVSWEFQSAQNDYSMVRDIVLQGVATTSDAVNLLTVYNPYRLLSQCKLYINGQTLCWHQDQWQILAQVSEDLKKSNDPEIYTELARMVNNSTVLGGDQILTTGTPFRWSMFRLFPTLRNIMFTLSGLQKIKIEVTFVSNSNSAENTKVGVSSTASNAWDSDIVFSSLQMNMLYFQNSDSRMLKVPNPQLLRFNNFYLHRVPAVSWNVAGVDSYLLQLNTHFPQVNKYVQGISCFLYDNVANATFNSATASQYRSGADIFTYIIRSRGNILYDVSGPTTDLQKRRVYEMDVYKNKNPKADQAPLALTMNSNTLGKYFVASTYIDLANVMESQSESERVLSGRDTVTNDITINFACGSAVSTSCDLFFMLHYDTLYNLKPNGAISMV